MSNLAKRLISAAIIVPVLVYLFYRGGRPFIILIEVAIALGINEYYSMAEARGLLPSRGIGTIGALALGLAAASGRLDYMLLTFTLVILAVLINQLRGQDISATIAGSATTIFGVVYIGWLLSHAMLLRFPLHSPQAIDRGLFFIVLAIAGVFLADAGAYFVGRAYGKKKLAPRISPGKTVEGLLGGIAGGTLGVVLTKLVFDWLIFPDPGTGMPLLHCLALGPLLVLPSVAGDLFESMLKRDARIKDSGSIIPGHGGIMDRLDSILFALPVTYYYLRLAVYGGLW
ncbi:MAG TPA: phosphatidate cytidylyltransferase [bacterium]|nr:phosphatidate cytidylyltransferase [bacterium]